MSDSETAKQAVPPPDDKADKPHGWYGFDLDGTLAYHDPDNFDPVVVGEPIERMVKRAKRYIAAGYEVRIVTARVSPHPGEKPSEREAARAAVEDWTEAHLGKRCKVTNVKDYKMIKLFDDRCVQVIPNTGITLVELVAVLRKALEEAGEGVSFDEAVEEHLDDSND